MITFTLEKMSANCVALSLTSGHFFLKKMYFDFIIFKKFVQ